MPAPAPRESRSAAASTVRPGRGAHRRRRRTWFRKEAEAPAQAVTVPRPVRGRQVGCSPVITRMSHLFLRTLRDDPADAEVASHKLLVRAGYVRRIAPGGVLVAATGSAGAAAGRARRARGDERDRRAGDLAAGTAAARPLRNHEPVDRVRRRAVPAARPQGRRLPARAHPRGDVRAHRQGRIQLLQGLSGHAVPDPDQVPGRGAAACRDPPRPRVRDEGLLQLRSHRRGPGRVLPGPPRRLRADLRASRGEVRHRLRDLGRDGRERVGGVPRRERGG